MHHNIRQGGIAVETYKVIANSTYQDISTISGSHTPAPKNGLPLTSKIYFNYKSLGSPPLNISFVAPLESLNFFCMVKMII